MSETEADAPPAVELDDEGKRLQLEAEKAKYLEAIAKARQATAEARAASLHAVDPSVTDAPKGEVKLGEKAGAFGPWRAHLLIDKTAREIATSVASSVIGGRVLVVDDRSLLPDHWTARHVRSILVRQFTRVWELDRHIRAGLEELDEAVRSYRDAEAAQASVLDSSLVGRRREELRVLPEDTSEGGAELEEVTATSSAATTGASGGALGAAVDLLGLLRTDYTIAATPVSATSSELATLTAGHLAGQQATSAKGDESQQARPVEAGGGEPQQACTVEADGFTTVRRSPSTDHLAVTLRVRDGAVQALAIMQARLAPVEAELTLIKDRIAVIQQAWATATAEKQDAAETAALRAAVDEVVGQASRREQAAGPARTLVAHAQQVVADLDAALAALFQAPEGGEAPLLTAVRRERLDAKVAEGEITHVLYVSLDAAAADAVTRRSILGVSGRIRFLSAGNASWLLLDTLKGTIAGGGQVSLADVMTFGLENGNAQAKSIDSLPASSDLGKDPLDALETWAKWFVGVLVVVLSVLGVLSVLAVIRIALG